MLKYSLNEYLKKIIHYPTLYLVFILFFLVAGCNSSRASRNKRNQSVKSDQEIADSNRSETISDFTLLESYYNHWTAGIESGGKGINYTLKVIVNSSEAITFDSLRLQHITLPVHLSRKIIQSSSEKQLYKQGDTLELKTGERYRKRDPGFNTVRTVFGNQKAQLEYSLGMKKMSFPIDSLQEIKRENRP